MMHLPRITPRRSALALAPAPAPVTGDSPRSEGQPRRVGTQYEVTAQDVYVRTHPMGLAVGALQRGDTVTVLDWNKGWAYGYANGHADRPGWMLLGPSQGRGHNARRIEDSHRTAGGIANTPTSAAETDEYRYVGRGVRLPGAWSLSFPATVRSGGLRTFANFSRENGASDPSVEIPAGAEIGVRYLADDGWAMLQIKSTTSPDGKPKWVFGRIEDVQVHDSATMISVLRDGKPVPDGYRHPK